MSNFKELLSRPLPSAANVVTEGVELDEALTQTSAPDTTPESTPAIDIPAVEDPVINPVADPVVGTDDADDVELSPEEIQRIDDTISTVATPVLLSGELTEQECKEFVESMDCDIAINEGFLTERTIVKFDKNAKKAQLYEVAVAAVAREKKDPLFKKLETVYKMERVIKAKLRKKYNIEAQKRVKVYLARAKKSKSGILARIANKIMGK